MQDDDESLVGIEMPEPARDLIAVCSGHDVVARMWSIEPGQLDLDRSPAGPPQLVVTGMDEQAVEPGIEPFGVTQAGEIPPGTDQGFLDGVLGPLGITEDEPSRCVETLDRGACERFEGVMIASLRSDHEFTLHGGLIDSGAPFGRAAQYGGGDVRPGSRVFAPPR